MKRRRISAQGQTIELAQLLALHPTLQRFHDLHVSEGYRISAGTLRRRPRQEHWTARIVMRNRNAALSTVTLSIEGLVIA
jgi:aryl carrier-like protein